MWASILAGLKWLGVWVGTGLFVLALPVAVAASLFGLPGSLLVLADATIYSACHGWQHPSWVVLIVLAGIAVVSEVSDNLLSFAGVKAAGATTTTGVWVVVGGIAGVVAGSAVSPLVGLIGGPVGWVLTALLPIGVGLVGGYLGGYYYELRRGRSKQEASKAGWAALLGRLAGGIAKGLLVGVMAAILLATAF